MTFMKQEEINKIMRKFASLGGKATLKKYGKEHFSKIAKNRWNPPEKDLIKEEI